MKCRRLGCESTATHLLRPQYGRPFPVCADHGPSWLATLVLFDNRQSYGSNLAVIR